MIDVFQAPKELLSQIQAVTSERELIQLVSREIASYQFATKVDCPELDIALAATGGPTHWVKGDSLKIDFTPALNRASTSGDILIEVPQAYVNLVTPAGFIPLVDIIYSQGQLYAKQLN
jgi:hypothetical protein